MPIDLPAALRGSLDQHRCRKLLGVPDPEAAIAAYRNPDGDFGWGLEPDPRTTESQIATAPHAFRGDRRCGPQLAGRRVVRLAGLGHVARRRPVLRPARHESRRMCAVLGARRPGGVVVANLRDRRHGKRLPDGGARPRCGRPTPGWPASPNTCCPPFVGPRAGQPRSRCVSSTPHTKAVRKPPNCSTACVCMFRRPGWYPSRAAPRTKSCGWISRPCPVVRRAACSSRR